MVRRGASEISLHMHLAKVEIFIDGQWVEMQNAGEPINDDGYDLEIRLTDEEDQGMAEYQVRWYNPVAGGQYRFVIAARSNQAELASKTFSFSAGNEGIVKAEMEGISVSLLE